MPNIFDSPQCKPILLRHAKRKLDACGKLGNVKTYQDGYIAYLIDSVDEVMYIITSTRNPYEPKKYKTITAAVKAMKSIGITTSTVTVL